MAIPDVAHQIPQLPECAEGDILMYDANHPASDPHMGWTCSTWTRSIESQQFTHESPVRLDGVQFSLALSGVVMLAAIAAALWRMVGVLNYYLNIEVNEHSHREDR